MYQVCKTLGINTKESFSLMVKLSKDNKSYNEIFIKDWSDKGVVYEPIEAIFYKTLTRVTVKIL